MFAKYSLHLSQAFRKSASKKHDISPVLFDTTHSSGKILFPKWPIHWAKTMYRWAALICHWVKMINCLVANDTLACELQAHVGAQSSRGCGVAASAKLSGEAARRESAPALISANLSFPPRKPHKK